MDIASHSCYELFFTASHIFGTDRVSWLQKLIPKSNDILLKLKFKQLPILTFNYSDLKGMCLLKNTSILDRQKNILKLF